MEAERMRAIARDMREAEDRYDRQVPEGTYLVARVDGRSFSRVTEELGVERPFDESLRDAFVSAAEHLMSTGFKISFAHTQSDEISLLFDRTEDSFARRHRKLLSVLAGEGSASLSLTLGRPVSMDCRLLELADMESVVDYFSWRQSDASRNCLLAHAYWALRRSGLRGRAAQRKLDGMNSLERKLLLKDLAKIDYELLPTWQRHGVALYHETFERVGVNPITGEKVPAIRRRIKIDMDPPRNDAYRRLLEEILTSESTA